MQSKNFPTEITWEEWKERPVPPLTNEDTKSRWEMFGIVNDENGKYVPVEFYKSEHIFHKRKIFEEFLYEYQQILKYEEFQFEDFPQVLDMGPDYLAWIDWIEYEMLTGKRIPYNEYLSLKHEKGDEYVIAEFSCEW